MGRGQRQAPKSRRVDERIGRIVATEGASKQVCELLGIPRAWRHRCEDSFHTGHDGTADALRIRLDHLISSGSFPSFANKFSQLGSYGGGNHFGECEVVEVADDESARSHRRSFGLHDGRVAFLSHCGSRGFGHHLAQGQFNAMEAHFDTWGIPYPGGDRQLCHAPLGTDLANDYLDDMALGGNFATVNHLLINALVLEAFQEVIPGCTGELVYLISHNIARLESVRGEDAWVMRKGATRAFPAGHAALADTPFAMTGHPILLPGNPQAGSAVMVADPGARPPSTASTMAPAAPSAAVPRSGSSTRSRSMRASTKRTSSATAASTPSTRHPPRTRTSTRC